MQYWVFFVGGVGGDGFGNLLEHANGINTVDGRPLNWRVRTHPIRNKDSGKVAFYRAKFFNGEFESDKDPKLSNYSKLELSDHYRMLVEKNLNTVVVTHPHWYTFNPDFKYWDLFAKDQIRLLVYSNDRKRIAQDFVDKVSANRPPERYLAYLQSLYTYKPPLYWAQDLNYTVYVDIEQAWRDWDYLNKILTSIGIDLDRKYYEEYLDVAKRRYF